MNAAERFWAKVDLSSPSGCWMWTGATAHGYGRFYLNGTKVAAHRFAFTVLVGPIPDGKELDHLCSVRACVNPDHLEPVDHRTNLRRAVNGNAMKTACVEGHPFDEANTWTAKGKRHCRACRAIRQREYRNRKVAN